MDQTPVWKRFVATFEDTVSQDQGDDAKITFDLVNFTGGSIDPTWTDSDFNTAFTQLSNLCGQWCPKMNTHHRFSKIDAYAMSFNSKWAGSAPGTDIHPFNLSGPPEQSRPFSIQGSGGGGTMPPQIAFSVTELVPVRRSWGRFYFPFPDLNMVDQATGRWSAAQVGNVATAVWGIYNQLSSTELFPVIPITYSQRNRVAALEQVTNIRCDDVPDVIRRRRFQHATFKDTQPAISAQQFEEPEP